jgi:hypothetical protein
LIACRPVSRFDGAHARADLANPPAENHPRRNAIVGRSRPADLEPAFRLPGVQKTGRFSTMPYVISRQRPRGKMGKNESLKITATFLNNVAVGIFVAGVTVPYFALFNLPPTDAGTFWSKVFNDFSGSLFTFGRWLAPVIVSAVVAAALHIYAKAFLEEIED